MVKWDGISTGIHLDEFHHLTSRPHSNDNSPGFMAHSSRWMISRWFPHQIMVILHTSYVQWPEGVSPIFLGKSLVFPLNPVFFRVKSPFFWVKAVKPGRDCGDQRRHRAGGAICRLDSPASWPMKTGVLNWGIPSRHHGWNGETRETEFMV